MSYFIDGNERVNKTALLLAQERYNVQYAPFVKSAARLSYLERPISRLVTEVCNEVGADRDWVESRFSAYILESAAWKSDPNGLPNGNNSATIEIDGVETTDVMDHGEVPGAGHEEAQKDGIKRYDLNDDTQKWSCFRCGTKLASVVSPVCEDCTAALKRVADFGSDQYTVGDASSTGPSTLEVPEDTSGMHVDLPFRCKVCGQEGTQQEVESHISSDHADVLAREQQFEQQQEQKFQPDLQSNPYPQSPPGEQVPNYARVAAGEQEDVAVVEPLPASPADKFDDMVQELANKAAASQFSAPDEQQIQHLASQLGISPDEIKSRLVTVAIFGNFTGRNGQLSDDTQIPPGYEEVSTELNAQANTQKALVPTNLVINRVAESMSMAPDLAYQMVKDRYGADLPDKYHAPVSGELHYYLPTELAGNQQGAQQAEQEMQQMAPDEQMPAAPPAPDAMAPAQPTQQF